MPEEIFSEAIQRAIESNLSNIHTCLPGRIESYDYKKQNASVKPLIKKKFLTGSVQSLPVINDVPVIFPSGSGGTLTFPLVAGDGVLLVFCERSIDTWLSNGGDSEPGNINKFALSDAIAIPGLYPFTRTSTADNNDDFLISFKGGKIRIDKSGKIAIGKSGEEIIDLIEQIVDSLIASVTVTAVGSQPLSETINGNFAILKTKIASLKGGL